MASQYLGPSSSSQFIFHTKQRERENKFRAIQAIQAEKLERKKRRGEIETHLERECQNIRLSEVLLLRNMVGPEEVDDQLEEEVKSECEKHVTVTHLRVFKVTEHNFPKNEAVRIFVQFSRPGEATKAFKHLNERYFGGRTVRATYYDEEKFNKNELAPVPGEIPAGY